MKQNIPLLSIVVPTRNRAFYAKDCIKSILSISSDDLELIVHDNSDYTELYDFVKTSICDERLVYKYHKEPLNTVQNFNMAMDLVNGEYVCFIGDDDGVMPVIIDVVKWAKSNSIGAVSYSSKIGYLWPSNNRRSVLNVYPFDSLNETVVVEKELNRFLKDGAVYYLNFKLPKVYHGVVQTKYMKEIRSKKGYYFGGLSIDIFASVSLSLLIDQLTFLDYPLTIAGSSAASERTHRTKEAKRTKLKDAPHFKNRGEYRWCKEVPELYSGATIWSESGIKALRDFEREDLIQKINFAKLAAHVALADSGKDFKNIFQFLDTLGINKFRLYWAILNVKIEEKSRKISNRYRKITKGQASRTYYDVENISNVVKLVQDSLEQPLLIERK